MSNQSNQKTGLAIFLIVIGGILLLENVNIFHLPYYFFKWQMILIALGVFLLAVKQEWESGVIILTIGSAFMYADLYHISFREMISYWPVLLILTGTVMLIRHFEGNKPSQINNKENDY